MFSSQAAHLVQLFDSEACLIQGVTRFLREGFETGCTCIALATQSRRQRLDDALQAAGLDPVELAAQYRYIALDAHTTLAGFLTGGKLDPQRFHRNMGLLVTQAAARGQPVRIYGDLVALLADEGRVETALQLEDLWNELSRYRTFTLLCAYRCEALGCNVRHHAVVRAVHNHVLTAEV
ncbi:MAG TPA: MEDS domain-containing protein [Steroidobacteraceae bacterium]|jgi:hypothetical protein